MQIVTQTAVLAALLLAATAADPQDRPAALPLLEAPITRVALFKNGVAVFTREGKTPAEAGDYLLKPLPPPVHGTVWATAGAGVELKEIVAEEADRDAIASSVRELLRANVGRRVAVRLRGPSTTVLEGTIVSVTNPEGAVEAAVSYSRTNPNYFGRIDGSGETLLLEREGGGEVAIPVASVEVAEFAGKAQRRLRTTGQRLRIRFGRVREGLDLTVRYAAKGATWAPSYRVDLADDGKARLSASAAVINEAEDLESVRLDLVTGVPNLKLANVVSPLALAPGLAAFLATLDREPRDYGVLQTQTGDRYAEGSATGLPNYGVAATGTGQEDLYLYPLNDVTLKKGSSGWYPLFSLDVPYHHLYQWEIPDYVSDDDRYNQDSSRRKPSDGDTSFVWHTIRLDNVGTGPWTTAPAETVRDGTLLGQDILSYTPSGGRATLRITRAPNVRNEESEVEIKREPFVEPGRSDQRLDRVHLRGELAVTNLLDRAIALEIRKSVSGELAEASPPPRVTKTARGLRRLNPSLELVWELTVAPAANEKVTYDYSVLVHR